MRAPFLVRVVLLLGVACGVLGVDDPYLILGVRRTAGLEAIKAAYRRKAKETHPDKNPGADAAASVAAFRRVVGAFEILSDAAARRRFDHRYQQEQRDRDWQQRRRQQEEQERRNREREERAREEASRNERKARAMEAQGRVLRISSLEQLRDVMLDGRGLLERSLFLAVVGNKNIETVVDDTLLFPYPFAGMSNIWWDDLLQTAKVRYNAPSELTQFFGVPPDHRSKPYIFFVKKGTRLSDFQVFPTAGRWKSQSVLEKWVYQQLNTVTTFQNHHHWSVNLYKLGGKVPVLMGKILPGAEFFTFTTISDTFVARDEKVDVFPGSPPLQMSEGSTLGTWTISSYDDIVRIATRRCVDMSAHCAHYTILYGCDSIPEFMKSMCRATCGACTDTSLLFALRNVRVDGGPEWLQVVLESVRMYADDMEDILSYRMLGTVILAFLAFFVGVEVADQADAPQTKTQAIRQVFDKWLNCAVIVGIAAFYMAVIILWQFSPNAAYATVGCTCYVLYTMWQPDGAPAAADTPEAREAQLLRSSAVSMAYVACTLVAWTGASSGENWSTAMLVSDLRDCLYARQKFTTTAAVLIVGLAPELVRGVAWGFVYNFIKLIGEAPDPSKFPAKEDLVFALVFTLLFGMLILLLPISNQLRIDVARNLQFRKSAFIVLAVHGICLTRLAASNIYRWAGRKPKQSTWLRKKLQVLGFVTYIQLFFWCLSHAVGFDNIRHTMESLEVIGDMLHVVELRKVAGSTFLLLGFVAGAAMSIAIDRLKVSAQKKKSASGDGVAPPKVDVAPPEDDVAPPEDDVAPSTDGVALPKEKEE